MSLLPASICSFLFVSLLPLVWDCHFPVTTCSSPYPAVMQSLRDNVQSHQFTLDKSLRKMKALLSRLTFHCYIMLFILQGSRFVDSVVLQITNDNIVCTHYAVSLNDCCQQKQAWFDAPLSLSFPLFLPLFTSAFVSRLLTGANLFHKSSQCTQTITHSSTTSSSPIPLLSKVCKPTGCLLFSKLCSEFFFLFM